MFRIPALLLAMVMILPATLQTQAQTITDIVASSGNRFDRNPFDYDILLKAVVTADLAETLADENIDWTVFAPNDLAFIRTARDLGYKGFSEQGAWDFLVEAFTGLGNGDPIPVLTNVLLYHVSPDNLNPIEIIRSREIETLLTGAVIRPRFLTLRDNDPDLRNPRIFFPFNVKATNGVIHTINRVLIPVDLPN